MNLWPFRRRRAETRGFTDLVIDTIVAAANAPDAAGVQATAALEVCAGWWARSLAAADVRPAGTAAAAVTPDVLAAIGRGLCRRGEALFVIDTAGGLRLRQAWEWFVRGGADPDGWTYRVTLGGPDTTEYITLAAAAVVHVRYATDPIRPHVGRGPLQWAAETGRLAGALEQASADEAAGPRGHLIPLPEGATKTDELKAQIQALRGRVALPETTAGGHGQGAGAAPNRDWRPERLGADTPAGVVALRGEVGAAVAAACGIGPGLLERAADGTGQRESYRRFLHATLAPLGRIVEAELQAKLDAPLTLDFDTLFAADVQGRARAWRSLVGKDAVLSPSEAARLVGIEEGA